MATTGELCARCSAPLTSVTVGAEVTCPYCGFVQRIEASAPARLDAALVARSLATPRTNRSGAGVAVAVAIAAMALVVGVVVAIGASGGADEAAPTGNASAGARPLHVAELAAWNDRQYHPLDAAGMPGSIGAVDPVAVLPWALRVARAWSPDAQVDQIQVYAVSPEGTVDARVDGASVRLGFVSPARRTAFANMQAVSEAPDVNVFLRIDIGDGAVTVSQSRAGAVAGALPPPPTVTCPTARVLASARAHGLAIRPHYELSLQSTQWQGTFRWRWYLAAPTGTTLTTDVYDPVTCEPI